MNIRYYFIEDDFWTTPENTYEGAPYMGEKIEYEDGETFVVTDVRHIHRLMDDGATRYIDTTVWLSRLSKSNSEAEK